MKKLILLAPLAMLTACGGDSNRKAAEELVRMNLKDPDSAQFGEFYFNPDKDTGCLVVNAKNSMGGYNGDQVAEVFKRAGVWELNSLDDRINMENCRKNFAN